MIPVWVAIIAVVGSVVGVLMMILLALCTRDKRMEKAQKAYKARRMQRAEEGHMSPLDRAQWIQELHNAARRYPGAFREEGEDHVGD